MVDFREEDVVKIDSLSPPGGINPTSLFFLDSRSEVCVWLFKKICDLSEGLCPVQQHSKR